jgi:hypothetical protein
MSETPSTEVATAAENEQALAEAFHSDLNVQSGDLVVPILKVEQPLSAEVGEGEATPGDLVNALSGENFGQKVEFTIAGFYKGRFRVDRDSGEIICAGPSTDSNNQPLSCGCHDLPYPSCPDAEEQYSARANRGDIEWGDGPPVSTTYNFLGFVAGSEMPVKLSLMRASAKDAKKLLTMLQFRPAPWDTVFTIETYQRVSKTGGYKFQGVNIKQGRKATAEERQAAVNLAQAVRQNRVTEVGDEGDSTGSAATEKAAAEEVKGGLVY